MGVIQVGGHRLLDEQMLAGVCHLDSDLAVGEVRRGHNHGIRIERLEQLGVRSGDGQTRGAPRVIGRLGRGLREADNRDVGLSLESLGEQPPAQSRADDTDSDHDNPS